MDTMRCKLIVLYMLDAASGSLSMAQISGFLLRSGGMDYFSFQEMIEEMRESGLVYTEQSYQRTLFTITKEGREALYYYRTQIPIRLEEEILTYLEENAVEIRETLTVYNDFYKSTDGNYVAVCQLRDHETKIVDLSISVSSRPQAEAVCRQWKEHYTEVYDMLMDTLVK